MALSLKEYVGRHELPVTVEVVDAKSCNDDRAGADIRVGDLGRLIRVVQRAELISESDYVSKHTGVTDRRFVPLDYEGKFQVLPFHDEGYVYSNVADLLDDFPRFVAPTIEFTVPNAVSVQSGDTLELIDKAICADRNLYIQCKHLKSNREVLLPLDFHADFIEVVDELEYTVGDLYKRLPLRISFCAGTVVDLWNGKCDFNDVFILNKSEAVECLFMGHSQCVYIPSDLPIRLVTNSCYTDEDFAQVMDIHDSIKYGEQLPLVVKVMDHAPIISRLPISIDSLLIIHSMGFCRKYLVQWRDQELLLPESYDGTFRIFSRTFAKPIDMLMAGIQSQVEVTKTWCSSDVQFDSILCGEVLTIRGVASTNPNGEPDEHSVLICSSKKTNNTERIVRLPMDAVGNFTEVDNDDSHTLAKLALNSLPVNGVVCKKASPRLFNHGREEIDVLNSGDWVTVSEIVESCAIYVSTFDENKHSDVIVEILDFFPLRVVPLRSRICPAQSTGIHPPDTVEILTEIQSALIKSSTNTSARDTVKNVKTTNPTGYQRNSNPLYYFTVQHSTVQNKHCQLSLDTTHRESAKDATILNESDTYAVNAKPQDMPSTGESLDDIYCVGDTRGVPDFVDISEICRKQRSRNTRKTARTVQFKSSIISGESADIGGESVVVNKKSAVTGVESTVIGRKSAIIRGDSSVSVRRSTAIEGKSTVIGRESAIIEEESTVIGRKSAIIGGGSAVIGREHTDYPNRQISPEYQVSEGAPMLPPKVGLKKNAKATTSQGESVYEVDDRRTSIGITREVHACGDATRRVKKLGQRRGMLRSRDFEDTVIPDNLSKNVTFFNKSVRPAGNLNKFSVREVVQLFRQLGFREEVILCFSGNRIDGDACSLLTKADMKRYRMNEKEISRLQDYIQESKHNPQYTTSNIYEVS